MASVDDLQRAETAAKQLESAGGPVDLTEGLDKLQGKWRLLYSSAFSSRSLGGSRPGLPTGRLIPVTLGQVMLPSVCMRWSIIMSQDSSFFFLIMSSARVCHLLVAFVDGLVFLVAVMSQDSSFLALSPSSSRKPSFFNTYRLKITVWTAGFSKDRCV